MYRSPPMITGASEHRSSTSAPRFALSLASRPNRFDNHLGLSAQPNTRIDRTHAALSRPMARNAHARACGSSPSGCWLFVSSLAVGVYMRRLCLFACDLAGAVRLQLALQVGVAKRPPVRISARATDGPTDRPTGRPTN